VLARTPLDLRPRRAKVNLDDDPESTEAEQLPPPLQPTVINHGGTAPAGAICRSLSDFLSNITETTCTNSSVAAAGVPPKFPEAISVTSSANRGVKPDETGKSDASPDVGETTKNPIAVNKVPTVSVTAEDVVSGLPPDDVVEESSISHADDSASVSSLLLDGTITSGVDISLLDDPFIAIGAGCEKDSLLEEQDASWVLNESECEAVPRTSSPSLQAEANAEATLASDGVLEAPGTVDTVPYTDQSGQ